ncbi:MAG: SPFH domain-containing protein [bacterium]
MSLLKSSKRLMGQAVLLIAIATLLFRSFQKVPTGHRGVYLVLGRIRPEPFLPGLHFTLPRPIAEVQIIPFDAVRQIQIGADSTSVFSSQSMEYLTGDENLLEAEIRVDYRITDPAEIARNGLARTETSLSRISESALVETLATAPVAQAIGPQRSELASGLTTAIQSRADRLGLGVQIVSATWLTLTPPPEVRSDFEAAQAAASEAAQAEARTKAEAEEIRQTTSSSAAAIVNGARSQAATRLAQSGTEAQRFRALRQQAGRTGLMLTAKELWLQRVSEILPALRGRTVLATDQPVDLTIIRNQPQAEVPSKP